MGDDDGSAERASKVILDADRLDGGGGQEKIECIEVLVGVVFESAAVEDAGAGFSGGEQDASTGLSVLGGEGLSEDLEFLG